MTSLITARPLRRIVLGITGGIAAYKAAELTRLLVKADIAVDVVMTEAATQFIAPMTLQALSGNAVHSGLWDSGATNAMGHIELSRHADAIVVAPASANFIAKLANGFADDLLSTVCLARDCGLLIAPAMNRQMWSSAPTQRNVAQVRADGVEVLGPGSGDQACGEIGDGRMLEAEEILAALSAWSQPKLLVGKRVLITAGPTMEAIDPVRAITNLSSGKMGFAMAQACAEAGAVVTMIAGPSALATPAGVARENVRSAAEMATAVDAHIAPTDIFVAVAAVADYAPAQSQTSKLKKSDVALTLVLEPTVDILARVAARPKPPFCVGFAAETDAVTSNAEAKRRRKQVPLLIANRAQDTLGQDDSEVTLLDDGGARALPRMGKLALARVLVGEIAQKLMKRR
ncbi:MAG: bifunctional phosphopantothenoylcysteine decarboxylase/phosphopantothenate--cysteine ligase CoaBC [Casimicrobiaceae bacterium]